MEVSGVEKVRYLYKQGEAATVVWFYPDNANTPGPLKNYVLAKSGGSKLF